MKTLYMETTGIETRNTVAEIQRVLGMYGADAILIEYENRDVSAVSFEMTVNGKKLPFRLPCRWKPVFVHLQRKRKVRRAEKQHDDEIQAKRVAWRQILRWVEAQLALVDTGMVQVQEVFLPYMHVGINETLYERIERKDFAMIEYKKGENDERSEKD